MVPLSSASTVVRFLIPALIQRGPQKPKRAVSVLPSTGKSRWNVVRPTDGFKPKSARNVG